MFTILTIFTIQTIAITRFNSGQIFWNTIVDQFYQHLLEQTKCFYFGNILRSCSIILLHFTKIFSQARWENLIMAGKDPPILLLFVAAVSWSKSYSFSHMFQKRKTQQFLWHKSENVKVFPHMFHALHLHKHFVHAKKMKYKK